MSFAIGGLMLTTASLAIASPTPATTALEAARPAASSRDHVEIRGKVIPYEVTWSEIPIKDKAGVPQGTVSGITYLATDAAKVTNRPVIFMFNGGPGASSSDLNFGAFGPKRWSSTHALEDRSSADRKLIDNDDSLLDKADLVMIDTPGTGLSHALRPDGNAYFYTAPHDAEAVSTFIHDWIKAHKREASPVYIMGESYGGYRISLMSPLMGDLKVAGIVLISPALDLSDQPGTDQIPDNHFVFNYPTMAVAAWHYHKGGKPDATIKTVFEEARHFAQSELADALQLGSTLPTSQRDALAAKMSPVIGLPAETIAKANLRIDPQVFLETLLPGRLVGRLDTRVTGAFQSGPMVDGRTKTADDPSLNLGTSNVAHDAVVSGYLKKIGVKTDAPYVAIDLNMNFSLDWAYGHGAFEDMIRLNPTPRLAKLMVAKPQSRLLLISGFYDMTTPILQQQYALTHADIPLDRLRMIEVAGPHPAYAETTNRKIVASEILSLIEGHFVPQH